MGSGVLVYIWLEEKTAVSKPPRLNLPPPPATMTATLTITTTRIVEFEVDREGKMGGRVRAIWMLSPMHMRLRGNNKSNSRLATQINTAKFEGRESKVVTTENDV